MMETTPSTFAPHEARRYGRQMLLPTIAAQGQRNLLNSKVLVIGAGGIGSSAALYLAAAGVPITILDNDVVEESNLHRQVIHDTNRAHTFKADSAVDRLTAINPTLSYRAIKERLTADNAYELLQPFDLVLDCTDNFEARYVINDACVLLKIPYISGSAVGLEGQITVIVPHQTACYRCLYPNPSTAEACRSCANAGVLGPVPGLIGCLEATEAIKFLLKGLHHAEEATPSSAAAASPKANQLQLLTGRQVFYDAAAGDFFTFDLPPRNAQCSVCGDNPVFTSMADTKRFLDDFHQRTQCAVRDYRGDIPAGHKLPIEEFHRLLTQQQTTSASTAAVADYLVKRSPILIVDVRSPIQFGIASLAQSPLVHEVYSSLPPAVDDEDASASGGVALINLPLAQLQSDDRLVDQLLQRASTSLGGGTLCVLCRRGVDSTVATRLLLERVAAESLTGTGKSTSIRIWNVEGGLTAWHQDVDPTFPMY